MVGYEQFQLDRSHEILVLRLADPESLDRLAVGELSEELRRLLAEEGPRELIVSLAHVRRCSSESINALVELQQSLAARDGRLRLCEMRPEVRRSFGILRLDGTLFTICDEVGEALRDLAS